MEKQLNLGGLIKSDLKRVYIKSINISLLFDIC